MVCVATKLAPISQDAGASDYRHVRLGGNTAALPIPGAASSLRQGFESCVVIGAISRVADCSESVPQILQARTISIWTFLRLVSCHGSAAFSGLASRLRDLDFVVSDFLRRLIGLD